jgi:hypothetical protein
MRIKKAAPIRAAFFILYTSPGEEKTAVVTLLLPSPLAGEGLGMRGV